MASKKTWWQVYVNGQVFGFKTEDLGFLGIIILDHPNREWKSRTLSEYKKWLLENRAQVWKIADIYY